MDWQAVADALKRELRQRGWDQARLVRESGVTAARIRALMRADGDSYRAGTLAKIEDALAMPPGWIERVGTGQPEPAPEPADAGDEVDRIITELDSMIDVLVQQRERLIQQRRQIRGAS